MFIIKYGNKNNNYDDAAIDQSISKSIKVNKVYIALLLAGDHTNNSTNKIGFRFICELVLTVKDRYSSNRSVRIRVKSAAGVICCCFTGF